MPRFILARTQSCQNKLLYDPSCPEKFLEFGEILTGKCPIQRNKGKKQAANSKKIPKFQYLLCDLFFRSSFIVR